MKLGIALLLALSLAAPASAQIARTVTFGKSVPPAGSTCVSQQTTDVKIVGAGTRADGARTRTPPIEMSTALKTTTAYLAWDGSRPTKVRKTYDEVQAVASDSRKDAARRKLAGRTFILELVAGRVDVTDGDGNRIASDLAAKVKDDTLRKNAFVDLYDGPRVKILAGRSMTIGESIEIPSEALLEDVDGTAGVSLKTSRLTLTLVGLTRIQDRECAAFEVKGRVTGAATTEEGMPIPLSFEVTGMLKVAVDDSSTLEADVLAAISGEIPMTGGSVVLDGSFRMVTRETWTRVGR
jgi:hypothetical protein